MFVATQCLPVLSMDIDMGGVGAERDMGVGGVDADAAVDLD